MYGQIEDIIYDMDRLNKMNKEELLKEYLKVTDLLDEANAGYSIMPNGEYYVHRTEIASGKVFYKIALPRDPNSVLKDAFYPNFLKTPYKMVTFGAKNNNIPDKSLVKIKSFKELFYKRGYYWTPTIKVLDFEIIPNKYASEELSNEENMNTYMQEEDDLLF